MANFLTWALLLNGTLPPANAEPLRVRRSIYFKPLSQHPPNVIPERLPPELLNPLQAALDDRPPALYDQRDFIAPEHFLNGLEHCHYGLGEFHGLAEEHRGLDRFLDGLGSVPGWANF